MNGGMDVAIVICFPKVPVSSRKYKMRIEKCTGRYICGCLGHEATYGVGAEPYWFLNRNRLGLIFIMGSLITMHPIVNIFIQRAYCSFHFGIILSCYPGHTMSTLLVSFSDQIECAILSCPGRAVFVPSVTCRGWKRHVTNNTTLKIIIISVLLFNYT